MLTEKDYCGQNIEDLLAEVGFPIRDYQFCLQGPGILIRENVSLYEAQKWLREEQGVVVLVHHLMTEEGDWEWEISYRYSSKVMYHSYEEALSEGIKEAVKILKGEEK